MPHIYFTTLHHAAMASASTIQPLPEVASNIENNLSARRRRCQLQTTLAPTVIVFTVPRQPHAPVIDPTSCSTRARRRRPGTRLSNTVRATPTQAAKPVSGAAKATPPECVADLRPPSHTASCNNNAKAHPLIRPGEEIISEGRRPHQSRGPSPHLTPAQHALLMVQGATLSTGTRAPLRPPHLVPAHPQPNP